MSMICIKKLLEEKGLPNICKCPNCSEALEFYRKDMAPGARNSDPFPEKEKK